MLRLTRTSFALALQQRLDISGEKGDEGGKSVVVDNHLNDTTCKLMMEALMSSHAPIESLVFQHNFIGDEGAKAIAELISKKPTFTLLDLESNEVGDLGFIELLKAMSKHAKMRSLYVEDNRVTDRSARAFAKAICEQVVKMSSPSWKGSDVSISLKNNNCGDGLGKTLATALGKLKSFKKLQLRGELDLILEQNNIGDEGCFRLYDILSQSSAAYKDESGKGLEINLANCSVSPALKIDLSVVRKQECIRFSTSGKTKEMLDFFSRQKKHVGVLELLPQLLSQGLE